MSHAEAFVVGDVHGMRRELKHLLNHWDSTSQQLIFVGDYIDRGPNSAETLKQVVLLQKIYGAICLRGNHEQMLIDFLRFPQENWPIYQRNGGLATVAGLIHESEEELMTWSAQELAETVKNRNPWLYDWLSSLGFYYEFGDFIVVHAGIDLFIEDWRNTSKTDFLWIREAFHLVENRTGRKIIFGHTPWRYFDQMYASRDFLQEDGKYSIDGGAVYGGPLVALRINHTTVLEQIQAQAVEV